MDFESLLAQLLSQRAMQTKAESDAQHGPVIAQLRAAKTARSSAMIQRRAKTDNMPVFDRSDELNRATQADQIAGAVERGQVPQGYLTQGLHPGDIAGAMGQGAQARELDRYTPGAPPIYGNYQALGEPKLEPIPPAGAKPDLAAPGAPRSIEDRRKKAEGVRKLIQEHGAERVFRAMPTGLAEAISDQLQLQRERSGDPFAWQALNPPT